MGVNSPYTIPNEPEMYLLIRVPFGDSGVGDMISMVKYRIRRVVHLPVSQVGIIRLVAF